MDEKENEFHASNGWLSKFMERNNFGIRRRTTTTVNSIFVGRRKIIELTDLSNYPVLTKF